MSEDDGFEIQHRVVYIQDKFMPTVTEFVVGYHPLSFFHSAQNCIRQRYFVEGYIRWDPVHASSESRSFSAPCFLPRPATIAACILCYLVLRWSHRYD